VVQGVGPYASGDKAPVIVDAIVSVPSASATTISVGARVGWDEPSKLAVSTAGTYALGGAYVAKTNGQTRVICRLNRQKIT
jgi:predicted RecA/RadA family phage recombinase